jgi:hypothetical protein
MSVEVVCQRHYTLRLKNGHCISFKPNKPKNIPDDAVSEAMAVNIVPTQMYRDETPEPGSGKSVKINMPQALREALIFQVISDLVDENNHEDFDGGGAPKLAKIVERTGLTMVNKERVDYWGRFRECKATNSELPKHKLTDIVLEVQYLSTPKDTRDYAASLDIPESDIIGRPVSQQKKIILSHILKQV